MKPSTRSFVVLFFTILLAPMSVAAQATSNELRELRAEMQRLREEIAALRREMHEGRTTPAVLTPAQYPAQTSASAAPNLQDPQGPSLEMLQAQIAEHAQTKVESNSRFPVKVFGAITSNIFANLPEGGRQNDPEFPTIAIPTAGLAGSNAPFGFTLRQTRLGALIDGPTIGEMRSSGLVMVDFFNSAPRLVYAYARIEGERTAIQIGQDHLLFAPQNPTSLAMTSFPQFFNSGNIYLRLPQVRVEHKRSVTENSTWTVAAGLAAPRSGPVPTVPSVFPPINARAAWRTRRPSGHSMEVGASGYYGKVRLAGIREDSWGFAVDFDARAGRFGVGGEMFVAQELPQLGAAIGQFGRSAGGFIEGRWQATPKLDFNAGFGTDRVFDFSVAPLATQPRHNNSVFGNFIYRFTPEFETSFEYRWLSTDPVAGAFRPNNHLNLVFVYRF